MKRFLKIIVVLAGLAALAVILTAALTPWMDRWGATDDEVATSFPGDDLLAEPASFLNRAVTVHATPEEIYPWIVQLGADKGGMYSYARLEALLRCSQVNADSIHPEWQQLEVGNEMKMCATDPAPPPYIIAQIVPDESIVMGHKENGEWVDVWAFIIVPQRDGTSRLMTRTRTNAVGGFWTVIHPGVFIMERGMLLGIKERAEQISESSAQ